MHRERGAARDDQDHRPCQKGTPALGKLLDRTRRAVDLPFARLHPRQHLRSAEDSPKCSRWSVGGRSDIVEFYVKAITDRGIGPCVFRTPLSSLASFATLAAASG